ncbi:NAD(P)-binding protein [Moesziomyces antarcticus]|uniref:Related to alcohol dehydrogenase n=1 Tax=Pseudozyma antarctica TaxID=84753 RepID=A0A5C3FIK6_PSEA2|nr:NAD(P)-binding protein [Moesziomyces antarcticus]GAK62963.1 NAD(P)-binding protein [Moesziomyces antarcticus]SPO43557.1 related to alcohol dehydrogenase [Moesziomyces antarcticus]
MSTPRTTQAYRLSSFDKSLEGLVLDDKVALPDVGQLAPTSVLVEVHAVSLNARDYQIASATYPAPTTPPAGLIPVSDGAGKVLAVGSAVSTVKTGDRVVTHLSSDWRHGEIGNEMQASALGGGRDGVLAKHVVLDQYNLLRIPAHMDYRQAASLPVAGLTAYHCLLGFPKTVQQGQTVLIEGTGGVSIAALQIALAAGARPIVISSSDDKLKLCQSLGVHKDDCINYSNDKNWWQTVRARTPRGEGVDHTVEIAGGSTLNRALMATKAYGSVWVVGYMDDYKSTKDSDDGLPDTAKAILYSQAQVQGVMCGSYKLFQQYLEAHATAQRNVDNKLAAINVLQPLVIPEQVFSFADAKKAFELQGSGRFVGKVIIDVADAN